MLPGIVKDNGWDLLLTCLSKHMRERLDMKTAEGPAPVCVETKGFPRPWVWWRDPAQTATCFREEAAKGVAMGTRAGAET